MDGLRDEILSPKSLPPLHSLRTPTRATTRSSSSKKKKSSASTSSPTTTTTSPTNEFDPLSPLKTDTPSPLRARSNSNKKLPSSRKGSDARRAATADRIAREAERLEALYKEEEAKKLQMELEMKRQQREKQQQQKKKMRLLFVVMSIITVVIGVVCADSSFLLSHLPLPTASTRSKIQDLTAELSFLELPIQQIDRIESALLAHAQSYDVALDEDPSLSSSSSSAPSHRQPDADSSEWVTGGVGLFQGMKPLVMVFVTDPTADSALPSVGDSLTSTISSKLGWTFESLPVLDLQSACRRQFGSTGVHKDGWSTGITAGQLRSVVDQFFRSTASSSSFPPLQRGLVYVREFASLPRDAAEFFHRYLDDVQAPEQRVAYIMQTSALAKGSSVDVTNLLAHQLETSWTNAESDEQPGLIDEVIQPLLGRIIRNVIDLRNVKQI